MKFAHQNSKYSATISILLKTQSDITKCYNLHCNSIILGKLLAALKGRIKSVLGGPKRLEFFFKGLNCIGAVQGRGVY